MRSSCQTRALSLDAGGQGARQIGHPCPVAGGKRPVSRPADESGLKPSLATTIVKASDRVIADPPGLRRTKEGLERRPWETACFPLCGKGGVEMSLAGNVLFPNPSFPLPARDVVSHERDVFT